MLKLSGYSRKGFSVALAACGLLASSAMASLSDWNVTPGRTFCDIGVYANWTPGSPANPNNPNAQASGLTGGISWAVWDGYGPHGYASVGSNHNLRDFGGQQFDAKAMYARNDANNLYVGIVTGLNPAGSRDPYATSVLITPGDLAIDPNWAESTARLGVILPHTASGNSGTTSLVAGGQWHSPESGYGWTTPPLSDYRKKGQVTENICGWSYEDVAVAYMDAITKESINMRLLELTIPLASLGRSSGDTVNLSWTMSCSNDSLTLSHVLIPTDQPPVPEPASMGLLAMGGLLVSRRRK